MLLNTRIIKGVFALLCMGILLSASLAQQTPAPATAKQSQEDRTALHQALLDLTNPWTVMCIAAHPDDEDGTSLIVMRRKHGAHTVSLFTTFGEGGQNAIGPELYEELGAIRIRETKAASEIQGSEPYFLGLKDFGYSKSAEEAFRIWGHEESLRRMVLQIRKLRPDVIITNHDTSRGHGHHQATGQLILEAFDAAADPKQFPDQLRWDIQPWQVQRLFVRAFGGAPASSGQKPEGVLVTIDPNERDAIRGTIFAEQALQALQQHATQGPWPRTVADMARSRNSPDGKLPLVRYRLVRAAKDVDALPENSHNLLDGLRWREDSAKELAPPTIDGRPLTEFIDQPNRVLAALVDAEKKRVTKPVENASTTSADPRVMRMRRIFNSALAAVTGVSAKILSDQAVLPPEARTTFHFVVSNNGTVEIKASSVIFGAGYTDGHVIMSPVASLNTRLPPGGMARVPITYQVPAKTALTTPVAEHLYEERTDGYPLAASVLVEVQGVKFEVQTRRAIDIAAAVEITEISPRPLVLSFRKSVKPPVLRLKLTNYTAAPVKVGILPWSSFRKFTPQDCQYDIGARAQISVTCAIGGLEVPPPFGKNSVLSTERVNLPVQDLRTKSVVGFGHFQTVWTGAEVAQGVSVGYIRGFDYSVPNALAALGVPAKELTIADVRAADLQQYSAIMVDNRVYESQPQLIAANQRLLDYAKDGGTLIVFYHKSNEWNPDPRRNRPQLAPYPIILGDERVTDENAPVTVMAPGHPLLSVPNKIEQSDFNGWIQERGLYYPKEWDGQYYALLSTNDPGEESLNGGLLVADYGRGHYIYTSMVWYRQLRAGVPGAYSMLANMISYGK
ncbi:MAG: PIG-L family deacetylase [Pyrinomonadaceae bacterium]